MNLIQNIKRKLERSSSLMDNQLAKDIITEYCFSDFNMQSIYKFVDPNITDPVDIKLYADALLAKALQKGVIALNQQV